MLALLILGGISLGASALAFLLDEETESERERQQDLAASHERFVRSEADRREGARSRYVALYLNHLRDKRHALYETATELRSAVESLRGRLREQLTPLRAAALRALLRRLESRREPALHDAELAALGSVDPCAYDALAVRRRSAQASVRLEAP